MLANASIENTKARHPADSASKRIAQAMRSLGWSYCRMGSSGAREWGWARRDYDIGKQT